MDELGRNFPDLSASVIKGVFDSVGGNVEQTKDILGQFTNEELSEAQIKSKLRELDADFGILGEEVLLGVLKAHKWDVEKAIVPLFGLLEKKKQEILLENRKLRQEEAKRTANAFLVELFQKVPEKQIQQMLDDNDGNVEKTTEQLFEFMKKQENDEKKEKELEQLALFRKQQAEAIAIRFSVLPKEVENLLIAKNWDINAGIQDLLKIEQERKKERIVKLFPLRRPEEIVHVLEENTYDEGKTISILENRVEYENQQRKKKEMEEVKRREEKLRLEEERKREEIRKKEEERKKLEAIVETEKRLEMQKKLDAERQLEEQRKREYERKLDEERIREEVKRKEEEKRLESLRKIAEERRLKEQNEALIHRSILIEREVIKEVEQANDYLMNAIGNHLRVIPVGGVIEKNKQEQPNNNQVLLKANEMVDYGETITLNWSNAPKGTKNNWIGFYREGASSSDYLTYHWVEGDSGTLEVKAPNISGNYMFRFYINKSYVNWGSSGVTKVGPTFSITPTVINDTEVLISVKQLSGQPCPYAWVGMYEPTKDNSNYYTYYYLGSNYDLTFKIPKVGIWEFRMFPQKSTTFVAASCRINLTGEDSIHLAVNTNTTKSTAQIIISFNVVTLDPNIDGPWIGIFTQTETDVRQYRRYRKIRTREGEIEMDAMKTPGTYEARLYSTGSDKIYSRSNLIVIPST